jgi:hypothetical protein
VVRGGRNLSYTESNHHVNQPARAHSSFELRFKLKIGFPKNLLEEVLFT